MTTWQPSHRRESDGEVKSTFTEGRGEDRREVSVVPPEVYSEHDPEPSDVALRLASEMAQGLLRGVLDSIAAGSVDSTAVRLAAWRKHLGHDNRSLAEIAEALDVSVGNLHRLTKELPARLNGVSEVKREKS
jgi:hypothetical protein